MISTVFHALFYDPIYNALVAIVAVIPGGDVGLAVVLVTILIRVVLLPFTLSAARATRAMKALEPKLKELKELHKDDKEKHALAQFELYKAEKVNPFASLLMLFVQLPVLIALFWVFNDEPFTAINTALLYGFTPIPDATSLYFLGIIYVMGKSIVLALLAGITQYFQAAIALSGPQSTTTGGQADFVRIMNTQMKYVFPIIIIAIAYSTSAAIALYFVTMNIAGILQELYVRREQTQS